MHLFLNQYLQNKHLVQGNFVDPAQVDITHLKVLVILLTCEFNKATIFGSGHFEAIIQRSYVHRFCHNKNSYKGDCAPSMNLKITC